MTAASDEVYDYSKACGKLRFGAGSVRFLYALVPYNKLLLLLRIYLRNVGRKPEVLTPQFHVLILRFLHNNLWLSLS